MEQGAVKSRHVSKTKIKTVNYQLNISTLAFIPMRISTAEKEVSAKKEVLIPGNANSISNYNFSQCMHLLNKLKHLDSDILQSPYYQYIIKTLETRLKRLAHNKAPHAPVIVPGSAARVMV